MPTDQKTYYSFPVELMLDVPAELVGDEDAAEEYVQDALREMMETAYSSFEVTGPDPIVGKVRIDTY